MGALTKVWGFALSMAGLGVLFCAWMVAWKFEFAPNVLLPSPIATLVELSRLLTDRAFVGDLGATLARTILGLAIAAMVGIPFGLLLGMDRIVERTTSVAVDFLRSIPAPALFPLAILFFGITDASKIAVVVYGGSLLMAVQTAYGVRKVSSIRHDVLTTLGASRWQRMRLHLVPEIAPFIAAGLRLAASLSLILVVVSEMLLGGVNGLGARIVDAQNAYRIEELYGTIVLVGIIGYALNALLQFIETRLVFWRPPASGTF